MLDTRQLVTLGGIVITAAVVGIAAERLLPVMRVAENWSRDLRVATLTPPAPQSDRIVVVAVTTRVPGRMPPPRLLPVLCVTPGIGVRSVSMVRSSPCSINIVRRVGTPWSSTVE